MKKYFTPKLAVFYIFLIFAAVLIVGIKAHRLPSPGVLDICIDPQEFEKAKMDSLPVITSGVVSDAFLIYLKKLESTYELQIMLWGTDAKTYPGASNKLKIIFLDDNKRMQIFSGGEKIVDIPSRTFINARSFRKEYYGENPIGGGFRNHITPILEADCITPLKVKTMFFDLQGRDLIKYFLLEMFVPFLLVSFSLILIPFLFGWIWTIFKEK